MKLWTYSICISCRIQNNAREEQHAAVHSVMRRKLMRCAAVAGRGDPAPVVACRSTRSGSRQTLLRPLELCQAAVEACVASLRLLQQHKTVLPERSLILHSSGAVSLETPPGPPRSAARTIGAAAVLGIMKCLPYELPSLSVAPVDVDAADGSAWSRTSAFVATSGSLKSRRAANSPPLAECDRTACSVAA